MKCEVPGCDGGVRVTDLGVVCSKGHAYVPREIPTGGTQASMPHTTEPLRMPFGKHRGEAIEDIPTEYIEWALENADIRSASVREEMQNQLELRAGRGVVRRNAR